VLPQGASPSTHPVSSDTNVTEFGEKPAGTAPPGTGCGIAVGDGDGDGDGVMVGVVTADGEGLSLGGGVPPDGEQALSETQTKAAHAPRNRIETLVRAISAQEMRSPPGPTWTRLQFRRIPAS
jgi:hypothetical protein